MFACTSLDRDPAAEKAVLTEKPAVVSSTEKSTVPAGELVDPKPMNLKELYQNIGYPDAAKAQKLEGKVIVQVLVGKTGDVEEHKVLKEADPILNEAVLEHLYDLKFEAGTEDGKPVKAWVTIPFAFKLQ
jgi:protein TonB